jgi:hypothetical protein
VKSLICSTETREVRESGVKFREGWGEKIVRCRNIGSYSIFYTYAFEEGQPIESPVFVVSNLEEETI